MSKLMTLVLFGEAEKGNLCRGVFCRTLDQLIDVYGHPPPATKGLLLAIQSLLYGTELVYFRVREEGYSVEDYFEAIHQIEKSDWTTPISAFGIPGVGDNEIITALTPLCTLHHSLIITTQSDFYDYITSTG